MLEVMGITGTHAANLCDTDIADMTQCEGDDCSIKGRWLEFGLTDKSKSADSLLVRAKCVDVASRT